MLFSGSKKPRNLIATIRNEITLETPCPEANILTSEKHGGEPAYRVCFACGRYPVLLHPAGWHQPTQRPRSDLRRAIRARPSRCNTLLWGFGSGDPSYQPADLTALRCTCGGVGPEAWHFEVHVGSGDPSYQPPCGLLDPEIPLIS